jgi:hypothetical protein
VGGGSVAGWALWTSAEGGRSEPLPFDLQTCYARVSLIGERQGTVCPGDKLAKAWPYSTAPQYLLANASLDE